MSTSSVKLTAIGFAFISLTKVSTCAALVSYDSFVEIACISSYLYGDDLATTDFARCGGDLQTLWYEDSVETSVEALIIKSESSRTIYLANAGTKDNQDTLDDLQLGLVPMIINGVSI